MCLRGRGGWVREGSGKGLVCISVRRSRSHTLLRVYIFILFLFFLIFFLKVMQCCIIQFPVEIRNRGWQGELIAATRDETFWEGWMGGHPG